MRLFEQIERKTAKFVATLSKPWGTVKVSHRWDKKKKHRIERRRAKLDPECDPCYRKYKGYEW